MRVSRMWRPMDQQVATSGERACAGSVHRSARFLICAPALTSPEGSLRSSGKWVESVKHWDIEYDNVPTVFICCISIHFRMRMRMLTIAYLRFQNAQDWHDGEHFFFSKDSTFEEDEICCIRNGNSSDLVSFLPVSCVKIPIHACKHVCVNLTNFDCALVFPFTHPHSVSALPELLHTFAMTIELSAIWLSMPRIASASWKCPRRK